MASFTLSAVKSRFIMLVGAALLAAIMFAQPLAGFAHEHREVGEYTLVVGFANEPAVQGDTNGMWVSVKQGDVAVKGLADTLKGQVIFGDQTRDFDLTPVFGEDGAYSAPFIPTQPGDYTFRFYGQIDGVDVDESFTSSPDGFDSVTARTDLEFPANDDGAVGRNDTVKVAMPLAGGAIVLLGLVGYAIRRRAA